MKIRVGGVKRVFIKEEYIKLDSFLKLAALVSTGGEAKTVVQSGSVKVNGAVCIARGKKLRRGDVVRIHGETLLVAQRDG